ncbi:MAG: hypothetical protein ABI883_02055 [Chthoniobacterales bacterium]
MINPNGDNLGQNDPVTSATQPGDQAISEGASTGGRFQETTEKINEAWKQTKETATVAGQRTQFYLRENPVPTVIGALAVGLAIGLAIRYSSERSERAREVEAKTPFGDINLGVLSLPFLWPFFKSIRRQYENSAEVVKDGVREGVDRLKGVDVDQYVKPLRKKWRNWTN